MGLCTRFDIQNRIAQSMSSSNPIALGMITDITKIGNTLDSNLIPDSVVDFYIAQADSLIMSALSALYVGIPQQRVDLQFCLLAAIDAYNFYVSSQNSQPLDVNDKIIIFTPDGTYSEMHRIAAIVDITSRDIFTTQQPIQYAFPSGSRVSRIKYPDPLPFISCSYASSYIYDRYFASQSSPNVSTFGLQLRKQGQVLINSILEGRIILKMDRNGRRLYNPNILNQYSLPQGVPGARSQDRTG